MHPSSQAPLESGATTALKQVAQTIPQAYELGALPSRKKAKSIYQFNLLSVVDTDLVRLMFDESGIQATALKSEHYLARYIVHKRETVSRIHFVNADSFGSVIQDYGRLHQANCKWMIKETDDFYSKVPQDWGRSTLLTADLTKVLKYPFKWALNDQFGGGVEVEEFSLYWSKSLNCARIGLECPSALGLSFSAAVLDFLNQNEKLKALTASALLRIYRYSGPFVFDDDIPF